MATEDEFAEQTEKLRQLGIEQEEIESKIKTLRAEHRSIIYAKKFLQDWTQEIEELKNIEKLSEEDNIIKYILGDMEKKVKRDTLVKLVNFLTNVSAFTENPLNTSIRGKSSTGKTYTAKEGTEYFLFDRENVWRLGGLTPKAILHEHGILIDDDGKEIRPDIERPEKPKKKDYKDEKNKLDETAYNADLQKYEADSIDWERRMRNSKQLIDLEHKIILFLEPPEEDTIQILLPILSHDMKEYDYKYTDPNSQKTITTRIRGYPSTICCSTNKRTFTEEYLTRCFTISPEESPEKFHEANQLTDDKDFLPWEFNEKTEKRENIEILLRYIRRKLVKEGHKIVNPFKQAEILRYKTGRDMRDFTHFKQLIKAITAINLPWRPVIEIKDKKYYVVSFKDVINALEIYAQVIEATRTGYDQRLLDFYYKIVMEKGDAKVDELTEDYEEEFGEHLTKDTIRGMLRALEHHEYVHIHKNPKDERENIYTALVMEGNAQEDMKKQGFIRFSQSLISMELDIKKTFLEWLKYIRMGNPSYKNKKIFDDLIKKIFISGGSNNLIFFNDAELSNEEKKDRNISVEESLINPYSLSSLNELVDSIRHKTKSNNKEEQSNEAEKDENNHKKEIKEVKDNSAQLLDEQLEELIEKQPEEEVEIELEDVPEPKKTPEQIEQDKKDDANFIADVESLKVGGDEE